MILGKVRIQNFKSIKDSGWVYLSKKDPITILAGQNESGKTSFLRALRFFEEGAYSTFEEDDLRLDSHPEIDLVFWLNDSEYGDLANRTNKELADYYKKEGVKFTRGSIEESSYELIKFVQTDDAQSIIDDYNNSLGDQEEKFIPEDYFDSIRPKIVFYSSFKENVLPGKAGFNDIDTNQAIQDFQCVYNIDFKDLMQYGNSDQRRTMQKVRAEKTASESLNRYWHQKISNEKSNYSYKIDIIPTPDPFTSYVNFYIDQGDNMPLKISQKSQGFQWFAGFILKLRAHEVEFKEGSILLLIDEPGQGLHEVAQQDVKKVIEEISEKPGIQVVYSTHQPILLGGSDVDFSRLILVDRNNEEGSKFRTISQLTTSTGSLDALTPIRSALGMVTLTDPIAKKMVFVVEGITEYYYMKAMFGDKFTIVPSSGVDQIPNIFAILYGWGVKVKAMVDDDDQGRKAYNKIKKAFFNDKEGEGFKSVVLKICESDGIENQIGVDDWKEVFKSFDNITYNDSKTVIENIKSSGVSKVILAKEFHDKYSSNITAVSNDTKANFKKIENFLNN